MSFSVAGFDRMRIVPPSDACIQTTRGQCPTGQPSLFAGKARIVRDSLSPSSKKEDFMFLPDHMPSIPLWGSRVMDMLLPRHCLLCGDPSRDSNLCLPCRRDLPQTRNACRRCALPLEGSQDRVCASCLLRPPSWDSALAALSYRFPADRLVCRFKFNRDLAAGKVLAEALTAAVRRRSADHPDLLVPVPLHRFRHLTRMYNQAELLARWTAKRLGIPVASRLLRRIRPTCAQSGLGAAARRRNTRGAFRCSARPQEGELGHVALVDDVLTTGATLAACSAVLQRAGAARVSVWIAARAPLP
jgi:ComF family protein